MLNNGWKSTPKSLILLNDEQSLFLVDFPPLCPARHLLQTITSLDWWARSFSFILSRKSVSVCLSKGCALRCCWCVSLSFSFKDQMHKTPTKILVVAKEVTWTSSKMLLWFERQSAFGKVNWKLPFQTPTIARNKRLENSSTMSSTFHDG